MKCRAVIAAALAVLCMVSVNAHKHHHGHHKHHSHHHDGVPKCETINEVLHGAKGLQVFAKGFDAANVQYLNALFNDSSSEATFLAVPDDRLGAGPTVFDQAHLRFLQHTIADVKIKPCKTKSGARFTTTIGSVLEAHKEHGSRMGRKMAHGHHKHHHSHHASHELNTAVADALARGQAKSGRHGNLYLLNRATSQRVQVLGSLKTCSGRVLLVSAFFNAPPSPDLEGLATLEHVFFDMHTHQDGGRKHSHEHGHRHVHGRKGHHDLCLLGRAAHYVKGLSHRIGHVLGFLQPPRGSHMPHKQDGCQHGHGHAAHNVRVLPIAVARTAAQAHVQ